MQELKSWCLNKTDEKQTGMKLQVTSKIGAFCLGLHILLSLYHILLAFQAPFL